ncbi:MAG: ANTAR domain-containing protein [Rhodobacteraceae bacterium]|nr:ANTAR domain-containing protein [Paracoccaceae bacterium]
MFLSLADPITLRAVLVDRQPSRRDMLISLLSDRGYTVVGGFDTPAAAIDAALSSDLTIFHAEAGGPSEAIEITSLREGLPEPLLALVEEAAAEVIERLVLAGADQVTPIGVRSDRISVGIASAAAARARLRVLVMEKEEAEAALRSVKLVNRAKSILMSRHALTEDEAHKRVQQMSMKRNQPVADAARAIIDAEELLG